MRFSFRDRLFRLWYWYVNRADKNAEILFMNYGYCNTDPAIQKDMPSEADQYSLRLYQYLTCSIEITGKDIVEVGCGRGGGLSYITKAFSPASAIGVDVDKQAVSFCKCQYAQEGLLFLQGDAQDLGLENNSCDVVLNVESSHRYRDMNAFLREVSRILRPRGYFLFTDFRYDHEMNDLKKDLEKSGMIMLKERCINQEVITSLELDDDRKKKLIRKLVPWYLRRIALNFAGTVGSQTYNRFVAGKYIYFSYVMQKVVINPLSGTRSYSNHK